MPLRADKNGKFVKQQIALEELSSRMQQLLAQILGAKDQIQGIDSNWAPLESAGDIDAGERQRLQELVRETIEAGKISGLITDLSTLGNQSPALVLCVDNGDGTYTPVPRT